MNQIPNTITCLNVLSGSIAILMAFKGHAPLGPFSGIEWAWIFIGIAAIADFCDGLAARLLHAYSDMGKELDSLCDLVSFGVAPAMILINSLQGLTCCEWIPYLALLIPVSAALRLAKFNIDTRQTTSFLGLPVPANAIFWIGYSAFLSNPDSILTQWYILIPAILVLCWLMISEIKLFSLKLKSLAIGSIWRQLLLLIGAIICLLTLGVGGLMVLILFYIALSAATYKG